MDTVQALTNVRAAADRLDEALAAVTTAQQDLQREALLALLAAEDDHERQRTVVRALYWDLPALPVKTLEAAIGTARQVRELAAPGPLIGSCEGCGGEILATSRTQAAQGADRCGPCETERRRLERQRQEEQWRREAEVPPIPGEPDDDGFLPWDGFLDELRRGW